MLLGSTFSLMPDADGALDRLVDLFYASAHDDAQWTKALDEARSFLSSTGTTMQVEPCDGSSPAGHVRCQELADMARFCPVAIQEEQMHPASVQVTVLDGWTITLSSGTVSPENLRALADHMRRSLELHARLKQFPDSGRQIDIWSASDVCLLVVQGGLITHTNSSALRALDEGRAIVRHGNTFQFVDSSIEQRFQAFMRLLHDGRSKAPLRLKLLSGRDSSDRALVEISAGREFTSPELKGRHIFDESILIAVTFVDHAGAGRARAIDALTALTPTEREILTALSGGETVESLAAKQGRSAHTLRWHVKNIIAKTGSASLTDAVRLAGLMLPL